MAFPVKEWTDNLTTPLSPAALKDMEERLSDYTDLRTGVGSIGEDQLTAGVLAGLNSFHSVPRVVPGWPQGIAGNMHSGFFNAPVVAVPSTGILGESVASVGLDEVQTVTLTGTPFTLTYSGQTTSALPNTSTAAAVQAALEALSNIGVGDVSVTGNNGGPYSVTFLQNLGRQNVAAMTATNATIATPTSGLDPDQHSHKGFHPLSLEEIAIPGKQLQFKIQIGMLVSGTATGTDINVSFRQALFSGGTGTGPRIRPSAAIASKVIGPLPEGSFPPPPSLDVDWFDVTGFDSGFYAVEFRPINTLPANCAVSARANLWYRNEAL